MSSSVQSNKVQGSLFEDDYLIRTLGAIAHSADIALTELVANAWDAGASKVSITIPDKIGGYLIVEDDGIGLTKDQFNDRWMKLGYNRIKHQGKNVVFPTGRQGNRVAYGRNGVGRHGLLCFNNEYTVSTRTGLGVEDVFNISTQNEESPFFIGGYEQRQDYGHGTRLEVAVQKNLPKDARILEVLSARFMHDPSFRLIVNGNSIDLEDHAGLIDKKEITLENGVTLKMYFIDSLRASRRMIYQGIAFWQRGRLVGEPSWIIGSESIIDGRTRFAKQYTMVVASDDLGEYVNPEWTGFVKDEELDKVYEAVKEYADEEFAKLSEEQIDIIKEEIHKEFSDEMIILSNLGRYKVDEAIESIAISHPTVRPEVLSIAVEAVINVEKSRSGKDLLLKLSKLTDNDIDGLNLLLSKWTIKDALCVLDEIDIRISTIEAIRKLSEDPKVDELRVLHPLVTEARWLFGPEFDSPEYVSNRQLQTAARLLFHQVNAKDLFPNPRNRPDLIVVADSTISITGTDSFNSTTKLTETTKILLIELKRGGFELTRNERNQLNGYIEDIYNAGAMVGKPFIYAYLVGMNICKGGLLGNDPKNEDGETIAKLTVTTFAQLVDTAERRLFNLRKTLAERYDDVPGMELFNRLNEQLTL